MKPGSLRPALGLVTVLRGRRPIAGYCTAELVGAEREGANASGYDLGGPQKCKVRDPWLCWKSLEQ